MLGPLMGKSRLFRGARGKWQLQRPQARPPSWQAAEVFVSAGDPGNGLPGRGASGCPGAGRGGLEIEQRSESRSLSNDHTVGLPGLAQVTKRPTFFRKAQVRGHKR